MTIERIQDQNQESQSTSNESGKEDINFTPNQLRFLEGVGREKKNKPNNRSDNSSNNLNENKHEDNSAPHMKASQRTSSATDMKTSQRTSSATDIKASQGICSATDTEASRSIISAIDEKVDPGKTGKVEKRAYYGTREEWITDKKNEEEEEAVDFEIEYGTRNKSQKKQGASNRVMKVIQLEDENKESN